MNKSQAIETTLNIAKELVESDAAMNDGEKSIANKINHQGKHGIDSLSDQEIEHVISFLFFSSNYSIEEIDDCVDFLKLGW